MENEKTVFCQVRNGQINGIDCLVTVDVVDGMLNQNILFEGIQNEWNEELKAKCSACQYHVDTPYKR